MTEGKHCSVCNEVLVEQEDVPALDHDWDEGKVTTPATCTQEGMMTYTCTRCGDTKTETIDATGHIVAIDAAVAPTCTETGLTEGKHCSVCKKVLVEQEVLPALDHDWDEGKVTTPATCTQKGVMTFTCTRCGDTRTETIAMKEHTEAIDAAVAPTCTETGLTEGSHCSVCEKVLVEQEVVPALDHDWDDGEVTTPATCTQEGVITYTCTRCGETKTEPIAMKEHTEAIDAAVAPTCTETGLTEGKHCSVCGKVLVEQEVLPALDHDWDEGEVTTPATCTQKGVMTYTCERCDDTKTETIAMKEHTVAIDAAVAPTCTETGLTEGKHCSVCKKVLVEQEVLPALDHDWDDGEVTTPATCTQTGVMTYTCTRCGDTKTETIAMKGHTVVIDAAVAPTCTETGLTEGKHCSSCGEVFVAQEVLQTIPHNYVNGVCTMCGKRDENYATEGLVFTLSDDGTYYSVTDYTGSAKEVSIPSVHQGLPVTSIGYQAFYRCSMTSVTIPDSVTSIGDSAFYWCSNLTSITIPDGVTSIGARAFYNCTRLTSVTIGNGVTSIGVEAFYGCYRLTSIAIPDSVTSIGNWAFSDCSSLTNIAIPDSITSIGYGAFEDCTSLTSVTIGDGVTSIGERAFYGCESLTSIILPDSVTSIGDYAFYACCNLTSVTIGDGVTPIGDYAFYACYNLTSVTIGNGVTSIGNRAFYGCDSLASITIPDSVTSIGYEAFLSCNSLTNVTIGDSVTSIGHGAFVWCISLTSIIIPDSVTSIGESAFSTTSLTSVTIGDGVASIGENAFSGCEITSITIPDSVTSIGENAFSGCPIESATMPTLAIGSIPQDNLKTVILTSGASIGDSAFNRCDSLTSITIGNSVTSIESSAFEFCISLTSISVTIGNPVYHSSGNCLIETGSKTLVVGCKNSVIPDDGSVTSIGGLAFYGCAGLTSITIPDSVTSIGYGAFSCCSSLTSITIPDSVTSIGGLAFYRCTNLTSITIPDSVTSIGDYAFTDCESLASVTIGDSVTSIGEEAFYGCESLMSVTIGDGVTSIGYGAFSNCSSLTSITIPDSVTSIGTYAFSGCDSLTSVTIGDGVTSIGTYAFSSCDSLTSVTIGKGVTSIRSYAFSSCDRLTRVTFKNPNGWRTEHYITLSATDLSAPAKAARYLRDTYDIYDWTRE